MDHLTINLWVLKYPPELDKRIRRYLKRICEQQLGKNHPDTIATLKELESLRVNLNSSSNNLPKLQREGKKAGSKKRGKGFGKE